jgi:hypothetical protein
VLEVHFIVQINMTYFRTMDTNHGKRRGCVVDGNIYKTIHYGRTNEGHQQMPHILTSLLYDIHHGSGGDIDIRMGRTRDTTNQ